MSRTDKILKLVAVGFSATELSRQSNTDLEKIFVAAKPLMESKEQELRRVLNREGKHSDRLKAQIAQRDHNRKVETEWVQNWKPLPPIRTVNTDIEQVVQLIRSHRQDHERSKEMFRKTGHRKHADDAQRSLQALRSQQGHLVHLTEGRNGNSSNGA